MALGEGKNFPVVSTATTSMTFGTNFGGYVTGTTLAGEVDQFSTLRGEVDNMRMRLEELIALVEKLEVESRYWHAKADILTKQIADSNKKSVTLG